MLIGHGLDIGGAQLWLGDLARHLAALPQHTVVAATRGGYWVQELESAGVDVHLISPFPLTDGDAYEHRMEELATFLAAIGPEVVVVNTREMFGAVDAARRVGLPVAFAVHECSPFAQFWSNVPRALIDDHIRDRMTAAFAGADRVVWSTDVAAVANGFAGAPNGLTHQVGIDLAALDAERARRDRPSARRRLGISDSATLAVWVGSYSLRKSQLALAEVAGLVRADHPTFEVAMVGRNDESPIAAAYAATIDRAVDAAGLEGVVHRVPERPDPWDWLVAADLFVCPSESEAFPYSVLEAMAFGVPVVATDAGGIPEMVRHDTGWLVPLRDVRALADAIASALADGDGRRARAACARAFVEEHHALGPWLHRTTQLIADVASEGRVADEQRGSTG